MAEHSSWQNIACTLCQSTPSQSTPYGRAHLMAEHTSFISSSWQSTPMGGHHGRAHHGRALLAAEHTSCQSNPHHMSWQSIPYLILPGSANLRQEITVTWQDHLAELLGILVWESHISTTHVVCPLFDFFCFLRIV
jgi:hypothetical protein